MPADLHLGTPQNIVTPSKRVQLDYLDGLRGLAALFVVISHACQSHLMSGVAENSAPHLAGRIITIVYQCCFIHGHYAVDLFIVLSGYCLMLPVARSADGKMAGGVLDYIKRRAKRILPPYYAALIISLLLIATVPGMNVISHSGWDYCLPAFTPGVLLSHLLLWQNHSPAWDLKIDGPMWSIAVEWQIYFLFPLILLIWRRFGGTAAVVLACILGVGSSYVRPNLGGDYAWLIGLFAMGMVSAVVSIGTHHREYQWRRFSWGTIAAIVGGLIVIWNILQRASWQHVRALHWIRLETWGSEWPIDLLVGIVAASLLVYLHQKATAGEPIQSSQLLRILQAPRIVKLGLFSYSLYLIHAPVIEIMDLFSRRMHLDSAAAALLLFGVGVPLTVGIAYLFHLAFERPFMTSHMRQAAKSPEAQPTGTVA